MLSSHLRLYLLIVFFPYVLLQNVWMHVSNHIVLIVFGKEYKSCPRCPVCSHFLLLSPFSVQTHFTCNHLPYSARLSSQWGLWKTVYHFSLFVIEPGVRGGAVGWGTALQVGRSRVRFPMESLEFFGDLTLPVEFVTLESTQPLTEMSTRNRSWG
jgi:hypothetical protein